MTNKDNKKSPVKQKAKAKKATKTISNQDIELEKILVKDEKVILRARIHGAIYWKSAAILIVGVLLALVIMPLGVLIMIAGAVMSIIAVLTNHYLLLAITNKRVLARYGLLQMDVVDIPLSKVESMDLERMLPGHIFGYANVVVMGTGQRVIRVPYIGNADSFRRFYNEMTLAAEGNDDDDIKDSQQE